MESDLSNLWSLAWKLTVFGIVWLAGSFVFAVGVGWWLRWNGRFDG